jgi:DNA-binding LytR/AlgR family response regulator
MRILLIEDDIFWRTELIMLLEELAYDDLHICKELTTCKHFLDLNLPDLIIADVLIGDSPIFDILNKDDIRQIPILFMTVSEDEQFFRLSKKFPKSLYLIKPFHKISLKACIENLLLLKSDTVNPSNKQTSNQSIIVRGQYREKIAIPIENIVYVRSELAYCIIKTEKSQFALKYALEKLYVDFNPYFLRPHRSYIINKNFIQKVDIRKKIIKVVNTDIPIGRLYKTNVLDYVNSTKF